MSGLTILYRMTGNSQNFARIKLGIKQISDSVTCTFILFEKTSHLYVYSHLYYYSALKSTQKKDIRLEATLSPPIQKAKNWASELSFLLKDAPESNVKYSDLPEKFLRGLYFWYLMWNNPGKFRYSIWQFGKLKIKNLDSIRFWLTYP